MPKTVLKICSLLLFLILMLNTVSVAAVSVSEAEDGFLAYSEIEDNEDIVISAVDFVSESTGVAEVKEEYVVTGQTGTVGWKFNVAVAGEYNLKFKYIPVKTGGGSIERAIYIDGKLPCEEVTSVTFSRAYENSEPIVRDSNGNDIRPMQAEYVSVMEMEVRDPAEITQGKLVFSLDAGEHLLELEALRESLGIYEITFTPVDTDVSYKEYLARYKNTDDGSTQAEPITIEAEDAAYKSNSTIYPISDNNASATPNDPVKIRLNTIGADKWNTAGQWIEWMIDVKADGFYKIVPRFKQNTYDGGYVTRRLEIDGEVPFAEAEKIRFYYENAWQTKALGEGEEEYLFYLSKGEHSIRMYVTMGDMAEYISCVEEITEALNKDYLSILVITGSNPDIYRDYNFRELIPETIEDFKVQTKALEEVIEKIKAETDTGGSFTSSLQTMSVILKKMCKDPESIAKYFSTFKDDLTALGDWLQNTQLQPLKLDKITLVPENEENPDHEIGFFASLAFHLKAFVLSFTEDYETIAAGITDEDIEKGNVVTVWISTGRDQSELIQYLADRNFTPETDIKVKIQLVSGGSVMPSVLSGKAADAVMSLGSNMPLNFAVRNAVADLTQFEDLDEVLERFSPAVMQSYTFNGSVYALPETMTFPMMFVREDIFGEMNLEVPQTWEEFYDVIAELQGNHLEIGFPVNTEISAISNTNILGYKIFLYQLGGSIYNGDLTAAVLDNEIGTQAFRNWTDLFMVYGLPVSYNGLNRFRSGEMPLLIADYTMYNSLIVFAPDIKNKWQMMPLPGMVDEKGNINNTVPCDSSAIVMLEQSKNKLKTWEFMKWWTSAETQGDYSVEMEGILGPSAKHPTANLEALERIPWSAKEYKNLSEQIVKLTGTPEIPGSYMMARTIDFSFNSVYTSNSNPETIITEYLPELNDEITRKRAEFGLDE